MFEGLPTLDELERRYLLHVLDAVNGNRTRAAEALGIDRRTLYRMAERFGLSLPEPGGSSDADKVSELPTMTDGRGAAAGGFGVAHLRRRSVPPAQVLQRRHPLHHGGWSSSRQRRRTRCPALS